MIASFPTQRGVSRSSRTLGRGCGGRGSVRRCDGSRGGLLSVSDTGTQDDGAVRVRRNRVVLTPPRWRQVLRRLVRLNRVGQNLKSADDGGKSAWLTGEITYKPVKPLRAGMPGDFWCYRCEYSCARSFYHFAREAAAHRCARRPPRPLIDQMAKNSRQSSRATRGEIADSYPSLRGALCDEAIHGAYAALWIASLRSQ